MGRQSNSSDGDIGRRSYTARLLYAISLACGQTTGALQPPRVVGSATRRLTGRLPVDHDSRGQERRGDPPDKRGRRARTGTATTRPPPAHRGRFDPEQICWQEAGTDAPSGPKRGRATSSSNRLNSRRVIRHVHPRLQGGDRGNPARPKQAALAQLRLVGLACGSY